MKKENKIPLLFEIGCEDIPARMLEKARVELGNLVHKDISKAGLAPHASLEVRTFSTVRRLGVYVPGILKDQPDKIEEVQGPPSRIAFNENGHPTAAAKGFARKCGVSLNSLKRKLSGTGEYLVAQRVQVGRPAEVILPTLLENVITKLNFPTTMYWLKKSGPRFIRPVRWILALLGEGKQSRIIKVTFGDVKASDLTYGHRRERGKAIHPRSFLQYSRMLRKHGVLVELDDRRHLLNESTKELVKKSGYKIVYNKELFEILVNSTEYPSAFLGNFNPQFLSLPRELLITVMNEHQKYLAVQEESGKLKPNFIAVTDWTKDQRGIIKRGHERVLEARFRDAKFFWDSDKRTSLGSRLKALQHLTFHSKLGSYWDKVARMKILGREIIKEIRTKITSSDKFKLNFFRALELSKCDLTTGIVKEFPSLQGIMGGLYASLGKEGSGVANAVYDHYLPLNTEDSCPRSLLGTLVSLTDKLDNILVGYALGLKPSGSSDPFALRRQGNGIVKLLIEKKIVFDLNKITYIYYRNIYSNQVHLQRKLETSVNKFFIERVRFIFKNYYGFRYDTINAVLSSTILQPACVFERAKALESVRSTEEFINLSITARRITNIIAKSKNKSNFNTEKINSTELENGPEKRLYTKYVTVKKKTNKLLNQGKYQETLSLIGTLRPLVDKFFDQILIMSPDPVKRKNRLSILSGLEELFSSVGNISEIVIDSR